MNRFQSKDDLKIQGVPKRSNLYARVAKYSPRVINRLVELLDSSNESVALGAAKTLLDKVLPDLKATDLDIKHKGSVSIKVLVGGGFSPNSLREGQLG